MNNNENIKRELGELKDKHNNWYWQIKLGKVNWLNAFEKYRIIGIMFVIAKRVFGILIYFVLLIPIYVMATAISFGKKGKIKSNKVNSKAIDDALKAYKEFTDIYMARVYSPLVKSLEISLFKDLDIKSPSLEIGIGDGYLSSLIFENKKEKLSLGSDMIYETILSAKKYDHFEKLAIFDAEEIPLPDNCVNTVIMNNLMHHLPSRKKTLAEVERILLPGGIFIFIDNLYGWIEYTFDSRLLRLCHLGFIATKWERFKMHLFAQKLLKTPEYWNEAVRGTKMEVVLNRGFVSGRAMTIASIFEYLNLLQGQPTRESMRLLLQWLPGGKNIQDKINIIIEYLIINDNKLMQDKDAAGAYLFVVLKKKENRPEETVKNNELIYVCPKCKIDLIVKNNKYICNKCAQQYAVRKGLPILLSYQKELADLEDFLEMSDRRKVRKYIT